MTAVVMFTLAAGKARTGHALNNPVLLTEGNITVVDGILAIAVLLGPVLNATLGWWWADPAAAYVLVYYAAREVRKSSATDTGLVLSATKLPASSSFTGQLRDYRVREIAEGRRS